MYVKCRETSINHEELNKNTFNLEGIIRIFMLWILEMFVKTLKKVGCAYLFIQKTYIKS